MGGKRWETHQRSPSICARQHACNPSAAARRLTIRRPILQREQIARDTLRAGEREFDVALDTASVSVAVFIWQPPRRGSSTLIEAFNPAINAGPPFGSQLGRFLVETDVGRTWLTAASGDEGRW